MDSKSESFKGFVDRTVDNNFRSAEIEMTVSMLIQIDKLVQLLESPVFTCKHFRHP